MVRDSLNVPRLDLFCIPNSSGASLYSLLALVVLPLNIGRRVVVLVRTDSRFSWTWVVATCVVSSVVVAGLLVVVLVVELYMVV